MFRNCPWNLNSSILVNSVAERQAQKRKIRNGKLPIPTLINNLNGSYGSRSGISSEKSIPSTSDSLPDTVVIFEDLEEVDYVYDSPKKCCRIPCTADTCSVRNALSTTINSDNHSEIITTTPKSNPILETQNPLQIIFSEGVHSTTDTSEVRNPVQLIVSDRVHSTADKSEKYVDLKMKTVTLESEDGLVMKLRCSGCDHKVLTVVQEKRVSFWDSSLFSTPSKQSMWSKIASIPISISNDELVTQEEIHICDVHWELSLRPSGWKSVALQINANLSKLSLYAVDSYGTIKVECIRICPSFFRNIRRMYTILLDSTTFLLCYLLKESKGTVLRKYLLSEDLTNVMGLDMVGVESNIQSLHNVNASKTMIAGIDEEKIIYMWNHITGNLIRRVDVFMSQAFSFVGVIEDEGYLFMLASGKPGLVHLLAFNISTEKWKILKTFSSGFQGCVAGYTMDEGLLLAVYQEGLVVWDMQSEIQLAYAIAKGKCIPFVFPNETVFMASDNTLFTLDNKHVFKIQKSGTL